MFFFPDFHGLELSNGMILQGLSTSMICFPSAESSCVQHQSHFQLNEVRTLQLCVANPISIRTQAQGAKDAPVAAGNWEMV